MEQQQLEDAGELVNKFVIFFRVSILYQIFQEIPGENDAGGEDSRTRKESEPESLSAGRSMKDPGCWNCDRPAFSEMKLTHDSAKKTANIYLYT